MKVVRKYLKNKLGKDDEYIDKILEFQKLLPVNSEEKVSSKKLCECLGIDKKNMSKWEKRHIVENEFFKENVDWKAKVIYKSGNDVVDYMISLEMGKHLSMMSKCKNGHIYRDYMIEMERICSDFMKWNETRILSKTNYNPSLTKFKDYIASGKEYYIYNEQKLGELYGDMLNIIAFGCVASELNEYRKVLDKETRDNLEERDNELLYYLQERFTEAIMLKLPLKDTINYVCMIFKSKYKIDNTSELPRLDEYIERSLNKIYN